MSWNVVTLWWFASETCLWTQEQWYVRLGGKTFDSPPKCCKAEKSNRTTSLDIFFHPSNVISLRLKLRSKKHFLCLTENVEIASKYLKNKKTMVFFPLHLQWKITQLFDVFSVVFVVSFSDSSKLLLFAFFPRKPFCSYLPMIKAQSSQKRYFLLRNVHKLCSRFFDFWTSCLPSLPPPFCLQHYATWTKFPLGEKRSFVLHRSPFLLPPLLPSLSSPCSSCSLHFFSPYPIHKSTWGFDCHPTPSCSSPPLSPSFIPLPLGPYCLH